MDGRASQRADPSVVPFLETLENGTHEQILAALAERQPRVAA